jgi:hypothetical protein
MQEVIGQDHHQEGEGEKVSHSLRHQGVECEMTHIRSGPGAEMTQMLSLRPELEVFLPQVILMPCVFVLVLAFWVF